MSEEKKNIWNMKDPHKLVYKLYKRKEISLDAISNLIGGQILNPNNKYIKKILDDL